jgi:pilus assembly protein CpaB
MDVKKIALLIGALLIAAVTAVMAKNMFAGASAPAAEASAVPMGPKVLVARKPLPVGAMVDAESFGYQPWPAELVQQAYYTEGGPDADPAKMIGMVVRNPITAGQPVTRGTLVGPQDRGFLAAALTPGMRAVTVPVSDIAAVAGFVFPGDRVDMVLTQTVPGGGDGPPLKVSETIIRNLRVLATGQVTDRKGEDGKPIVASFGNVTFEVTPKIAEKIAVAQNLGALSLALRSMADNQSELERLIASGQVNVPPGTNPAQERSMLMSMASQPADSSPTFATGGDVSRFQRRSVPARTSGGGGNNGGGSAPAPQAAAPAPSSAPAVPSGPMVRIARGNSVSFVPVGAR